MLTLIASQFRYCRSMLAVAAAVALLIAVPLTFLVERPEALRGIWQLVVLALGIGATFMLWAVEQKERRPLLWNTLPLRSRQIAAGRLLPVLLVQGAAGILAVFGMSLALRIHGHADPHALTGLLGTQGFALLAGFLIYLQEELTVLASPRRWALITVNVVICAAYLAIVFNLEVIFLSSWGGVVLGHALAAVVGAVDFALFARRRSFLVGISPLTGFPKDWSEAPAGR